MKKNTDYRNRVYDKYISIRKKTDQLHHNDITYDRYSLHRFILSKINDDDKNITIVDLGAGDGEFIEFLTIQGFKNSKGYDISPEQVKKSEGRSCINVEKKNIWEALNQYKEKSVDIIFCIDLIEHLTKNELLDLGELIFKSLKFGGLWVVHAPNGNSPHFGSVRYGDYTHEQAFTPMGLTQLYKLIGFSEIKFFESGPFVTNYKSYARIVLWYLLRLFYVLLNTAETGERPTSQILSRNLISIVKKNK